MKHAFISGGGKAFFRIIAIVTLFISLGSYSATLPKGTNLVSLVTIEENNLGSPAQRVMMATLQGLVARQSSEQIYILGGQPGYKLWLEHLQSEYGISNRVSTDPWALLDQFKQLTRGYVLYDSASNSNSLSAATSLGGSLTAIAVDASIEATVRSHGITNRIADVRARSEAWVWTTYRSQLSSGVAVEQKESVSANLRDYAVMANAFTFHEDNLSFRASIMSQLAPDAACFGGDYSAGEDVMVRDSSSNGVYMVGADWALSLSTLSSVRDDALNQRARPPELPPETNVHYVTFVFTDGDNVQWNLGDLAGYYHHPARGTFNMGWSISPALVDIAPSVLRWYYDHASDGMHRDYFTVGTSGIGYFYPSKYPPAELDAHVRKLNEMMERGDLSIVHVNDFNSFGRMDLWNKYLTQPAIDALFYIEYSRYDATEGALQFSTNGRPVIGARDLLWGGTEEEKELIGHLNSYPRDPSIAAGYTLVEAHVWSKNLTNVQNVVTNLAPQVRVVTPDTFVRLIRNNVGRKLSYDFNTGLEGWTARVGNRRTSRAVWTKTGNPSGALLLDGSDNGQTDTRPNASFSRQIVLPANARALSFETRAEGEGLLRVEAIGVNSTNTLVNWEKLPATNVWVTRTGSLTNLAGQTVWLYFEQNDGGRGVNEARYVDNIRVLTEGPAAYLPDAPRLLTATGSNSVALAWRNNDSNVSGFKLERNDAGGAWTEIAKVSVSATNYVDASASAASGHSYRLRAWNAAGNSVYSNTKTSLRGP